MGMIVGPSFHCVYSEELEEIGCHDVAPCWFLHRFRCAWCQVLLPAPKSRFPAVVNISNRHREHVCSGVVINRFYILTTGTCFTRAGDGPIVAANIPSIRSWESSVYGWQVCSAWSVAVFLKLLILDCIIWIFYVLCNAFLLYMKNDSRAVEVLGQIITPYCDVSGKKRK